MIRTVVLPMLGIPSSVLACIAMPGQGKAPITVASETAVIAWNPETRIERFIRTAEFRNDGGPIGFLVPTPTPPKLTAHDTQGHGTLTAELEGIVAPRYVDRKRRVYRFTEDWDFIVPSWYGLPPGAGAGSVATASIMYMGDQDDVLVFERSRVGGYDTAVLKAKNPVSLLRWLGKHGFESNARLTEWLRPYTEKGWAITAFRFVPKSKSFTSEPVELAFKIDRPFYPYREPRAEDAPKDRSLRVFLVTPGKYAGRVDEGAWRTAPEFSGPLPPRGNFEIAPMLGLPDDVVGDYWVTSFLDRTRVRPDSELFFDRVGDARPIEPPPVIRWVDDPVYLPKGLVATVGAQVLASVGFIVVRRRRPGPSRP